MKSPRRLPSLEFLNFRLLRLPGEGELDQVGEVGHPAVLEGLLNLTVYSCAIYQMVAKSRIREF